MDISRSERNERFKTEFKKRQYSFVLTLINFIDHLPNEKVSRRIADQLLRSGTSILANYVEGGSASSKKEFLHYFQISLKSANETKLWLSLLRDASRSNPKETDVLLKEVSEISCIFASAILTMKGKK